MSRTTRGIALVLLLCIFLVVSAPARLLSLLLPAEQVFAQGYSGTLWRGSASRFVVQTGAGHLHLGAVQWTLHPLSLLLLAPRLNASSVWGGQVISGDLVLRGQQDIDLYDFEARVAADLLRQFVPVALGGALSVQLDGLQLRDGLPVGGSGRLEWQNGGWQSPQGLLPLGTYAMDFKPVSADTLEGQVVTVSGPIQASGVVQLQGREYQLDIQVSSQGVMDPQLEQALSLIAAPGPQGFRVALKGQL